MKDKNDLTQLSKYKEFLVKNHFP